MLPTTWLRHLFSQGGRSTLGIDSSFAAPRKALLLSAPPDAHRWLTGKVLEHSRTLNKYGHSCETITLIRPALFPHGEPLVFLIVDFISTSSCAARVKEWRAGVCFVIEIKHTIRILLTVLLCIFAPRRAIFDTLSFPAGSAFPPTLNGWFSNAYVTSSSWMDAHRYAWCCDGQWWG